MEDDFRKTGLLEDATLRTSLAAFMLAWEMSLETAVRSSTYPTFTYAHVGQLSQWEFFSMLYTRRANLVAHGNGQYMRSVLVRGPVQHDTSLWSCRRGRIAHLTNVSSDTVKGGQAWNGHETW